MLQKLLSRINLLMVSELRLRSNRSRTAGKKHSGFARYLKPAPGIRHFSRAIHPLPLF